VVTDKDPFPLWDKYPSRWKTPVSERAQDRQQQSRQLAGQRYVHIYHEDNFVRVPTTTAVDHGEEEEDDREDHSHQHHQHHHQHHQKRRKPPHPSLEASMSTAQYYREKKKEEMFTRLALPAYAEHVSLQKRQFTPGLTSHVVATTAPSNDAHPSTSHHPILQTMNGTIEPHAVTKSKLVHILPIKG
jgi:G3E family GTPase